jgi:TIR domain
MATIFFSHSSSDDAMAFAVEGWLKVRGFDDIFVDHDSIRSGDKWTEALRRASGACRVVLSLVTPDWLASSECFGEFTAGWYAGRRMIPLLCVHDAKLDDTQKQRLARVLLEDQGVDISRAGAPSALDLDAHPEIAAPLIEGLRAAGALAKVGLDPSVFSVDDRRDPEGSLVKPPFPGLESFADTDADAAIFYGRSSEIAQVLEELREFRASGDRRAYTHAGRAYVIQGASGSGKSSLLKAGVLPRLRRERGWVALRSFRPGADPLLHFAEALAKPLEGRNTNQAPGAIRDRLLDNWRSAKSDAEQAGARLDKSLLGEARGIALSEIDSQMLRTLRRQLDAEINPLKLQADRPAATTLIAMDQGEELVRADGDGADALADYIRAALLRTSEDQPAHYAVVLTVRTDSFQELQTSPRLEGLATRLFDLRALPIYRFAEAIEQPAARYGVEIEPQLVEMLMEDAGGRDALPLLAFTLQRLWRQYEAERRIRRAHYESVGKLLGLIEDAAERALRGVDPSAQQGPLTGRVSNAKDASAQRVFVPALAQVNERGGTIRRVATLSSFDDEGREILGSFEKWRLVVTSGVNVEVAHEALFRAWPRFLRWLEPEKARLETLRGLESAAASWDTNGRRDDFISHAGRRLRDAFALIGVTDFRNYIEQNSVVGAYLKAAGRAARGWRIATWYTLAYFCVAVAYAAGGVVLAYMTGYHRAIPMFLAFSALTIFIIGPLVGFLSYLAAYLRQIALRSGFHSDIVVLLLVLGFSAWNLAGGWNEDLSAKGQSLKQMWDRQGGASKFFYEGLDDRTMGLISAGTEYLWSALVPVLLWVVVELVWILAIPFGAFVRKFIRPRLPGRLLELQNRYSPFGIFRRLHSKN